MKITEHSVIFYCPLCGAVAHISYDNDLSDYCMNEDRPKIKKRMHGHMQSGAYGRLSVI